MILRRGIDKNHENRTGACIGQSSQRTRRRLAGRHTRTSRETRRRSIVLYASVAGNTVRTGRPLRHSYNTYCYYYHYYYYTSRADDETARPARTGSTKTNAARKPVAAEDRWNAGRRFSLSDVPFARISTTPRGDDPVAARRPTRPDVAAAVVPDARRGVFPPRDRKISSRPENTSGGRENRRIHDVFLIPSDNIF